MIGNLLSVALGGAAGATLRYLLGLGVVRLTGHGFPLAIITVNVVGSFLMGAFIVIAAHRGLTHLSPLIATGFLGGFTTFSAFSLEVATLWQRGEPAQAALYIALSVGGSIAAIALGIIVARALS